MSQYTTKQCLLFFLKDRNESQLPGTMVLIAVPPQHSHPFPPFAQLAPPVRRKDTKTDALQNPPLYHRLSHVFSHEKCGVNFKRNLPSSWVTGGTQLVCILWYLTKHKLTLPHIEKLSDHKINPLEASLPSFWSSIKCCLAHLFSENFMLKNHA